MQHFGMVLLTLMTLDLFALLVQHVCERCVLQMPKYVDGQLFWQIGVCARRRNKTGPREGDGTSLQDTTCDATLALFPARHTNPASERGAFR